MDRRLIVALAVSVLVVVSAGCLGFGGSEGVQTTSDPVTTEDPSGTAAEDDPETTTPGGTATTTIDDGPRYIGPKYVADLEVEGSHRVFDGEVDVVLEVETKGSEGSYDYDIVAVRNDGGDFDVARSGSVVAEPNVVVEEEIDLDFRATGQYTIYLNGEPGAIVEVRSLGTGSSGDGSDAATEESPGSGAEGDSNPGAL